MTESLVKGVDFISVATQDLTAAREFYGEVLGLPPVKLYREDDPLGAEFQAGNLTIALLDSERLGVGFQGANNHPVALHVDDVEAARSELESRGVEFRADTMDSGVCHMAFFADPDGNALMLHNRYAPPGARPSG